MQTRKLHMKFIISNVECDKAHIPAIEATIIHDKVVGIFKYVLYGVYFIVMKH